jgi:hypothetical protein
MDGIRQWFICEFNLLDIIVLFRATVCTAHGALSSIVVLKVGKKGYVLLFCFIKCGNPVELIFNFVW